MGWMKRSMGRRSNSSMHKADIEAALRTSNRLRVNSAARTANSPTPQPRNNIDSYMLEAGIRPAMSQRMARFQVMIPSAPTRTAAVKAMRLGSGRR